MSVREGVARLISEFILFIIILEQAGKIFGILLPAERAPNHVESLCLSRDTADLLKAVTPQRRRFFFFCHTNPQHTNG